MTDATTHSVTDESVREAIGDPVAAPEHLVEVRRRTGLAAALGAGASLVGVAYLARAASGGGVLDWILAAVLGAIGVLNLAALVDARTPLLVADDLGIRLRLGRTWVGLPWGGLHEVEHRIRSTWWRDGLLTVRTHYVQRILEDLDPGARRAAGFNRRLHRSALAVPLGVGTRVVGAVPDLTTVLRALADGRTPVVETEPIAEPTQPTQPTQPTLPRLMAEEAEPFELDQPDDFARRRLPDPRPALAHLIGRVAARLERPARGPEETDEPPVIASETPAPARETVVAARAEVRREHLAEADVVDAHDMHEDMHEDVLEEETQVWADLHPPLAEPSEPLLIDDYLAQASRDPVIGPQFAAARQRLGLSVDELAERTRIRPHVIEAIEVDDFSACGGDFYARGHLRTLARVLGLEGTPMVATYDERYADAPIDPRRVFEAELAGAGSIRATRGGPNWSVLVAAVMALILCWSVARLVTGGPDEGHDLATLTGSGGPNHHSRVAAAAPVPVTLTAAGGGARVVVRDGTGKLVFSGDLAYGQKHTVTASPPVRIQSTDGSVRVTVDGQHRGRMGPAGRPATKSYVARR
ncbi:MAG TPA: helix-turn-helix domain-containing protein [Nocardioides sp.]|nr:helix-turn-helix domain-containing protein [Nocardioides sp.]